MKTAEWLCTACGATNRKLVADHAARAEDRCVTCHRQYVIEEDARPVRWRATLNAALRRSPGGGSRSTHT